MKNFLNYLTFALFASLIIFASCGGDSSDPEPTDEEVAAEELTSGPATLVTVTNTNNGDEELDWTDFTISFSGDETGGSYTVTGVPSGGEAIWPSSADLSTWEFVEGSSSRIIRGDEIEVGISVSETQLVMSFTYDETIARVKDITGSWVFTMEF